MNQIPSRALIVVGAALALGIGGGIAVADIPSSTDGTITACMVKPGGTIRLINAEGGATCKKTEQVVTWNQEGVPGQDGRDGIGGAHRLSRSANPVVGQGGVSQIIRCPDGELALGGGGIAPNSRAAWALTASAPLNAGPNDETSVGWLAGAGLTDGSAANSNDALFTLTVWVVCAPTPAP